MSYEHLDGTKWSCKYQEGYGVNQTSYGHFEWDKMILQISENFGHGPNVLWTFWTRPNVLRGTWGWDVLCLCVHTYGKGVHEERRKVYFIALWHYLSHFNKIYLHVSEPWGKDPLFLPMCFPRTIGTSSTRAWYVFNGLVENSTHIQTQGQWYICHAIWPCSWSWKLLLSNEMFRWLSQEGGLLVLAETTGEYFLEERGFIQSERDCLYNLPSRGRGYLDWWIGQYFISHEPDDLYWWAGAATICLTWLD